MLDTDIGAGTSTGRRSTGAKDITLSGLADIHLTKADGDVDIAQNTMTEYVLGNSRLRGEAVRKACRDILLELVRSECRIKKAVSDEVISASPRVFRTATISPETAARMKEARDSALADVQRRIAKQGKAHREAILDMPYVIDGLARPLREHIGADVLRYGHGHLQKGATMVRDARFLIAIGSAAGHRRIGDAVTAEEAYAIRMETDKLAA